MFTARVFVRPEASSPLLARDCLPAHRSVYRYNNIPSSNMRETELSVGRYSDVAPSDLFTAMPSTVDDVEAVLIANSPSSAPLAAPLMLAQGSEDLSAQVELTGKLVSQYCALNGEITSRVYAGADHEGVLEAGAEDILQYITDRYEHLPPAADCP